MGTLVNWAQKQSISQCSYIKIFFREHCRAREQASWAKPILICLSLVTLFLCSIIIHQRKVLMYTKNYKNERKRILSNSMSKAKGFYETPNAGN